MTEIKQHKLFFFLKVLVLIGILSIGFLYGKNSKNNKSAVVSKKTLAETK